LRKEKKGAKKTARKAGCKTVGGQSSGLCHNGRTRADLTAYLKSITDKKEKTWKNPSPFSFCYVTS